MIISKDLKIESIEENLELQLIDLDLKIPVILFQLKKEEEESILIKIIKILFHLDKIKIVKNKVVKIKDINLYKLKLYIN